MAENFHHRSTFAVPHKKFKGSSKGSRQQKQKGKVEDPKRTSVKNNKESSKKLNRMNYAKQIQLQKRMDAIGKKRVGSRQGPAKIVGLVALGPNVDLSAVTNSIIRHSREGLSEEKGKKKEVSNDLLSHFNTIVDKKEQKFIFYEAPRDPLAVLDIAKVADILIFVIAPTVTETGADDLGAHFVTLVKAQGVPSTIGVIQGFGEILAAKKHAVKKMCTSYFQTLFEDLPKLLTVDNAQEVMTLFRQIANLKLREIGWREQRSFLLGEHVSFSPNPSDSKVGTLHVRGYLRGRGMLSANDLVHITGYGDFQLSQIEQILEGFVKQTKMERRASQDLSAMKDSLMGDDKSESGQSQQSQASASTTITTTVVVDVADEKRESLADLRPLDALQTTNDQSIITEEEMLEAETQAKEERKKKVQSESAPSGVSEYQSVWNELDDEGGKQGKENTESEFGGDMDEDFSDVPDDDMSKAGDKEKDLDDIVLKKKLEKDEQEWPDEVEVPKEVKLRERFQRFRGLKSFRHSPWDSKESLPQEYSQIYQFADFKQTRKRVLKDHTAAGNSLMTTPSESPAASPALTATSSSSLPPTMSLDSDSKDSFSSDSAKRGVSSSGNQIVVHVINIPTTKAQQMISSQSPLLIWGLLEYEHKVSLLHFLVKRHPDYSLPIKMKEPLSFHVGFRRVTARPIYTQNTRGSDKHLCERFFQEGRFTVASIYGRIMFPPAPVLVFTPPPSTTVFGDQKEIVGDRALLVATGTLHSVDPDRLLIKRAILTGYPIQVRNRFAIIRYMFFNPDDIRWFKPIQLWTKRGAKGQIKEPRGTKGYLKAVFDNPIKQNDTVCMSLYKRQYPPWEVNSFG